MSDYLTIRQAAADVGVHPWTIWRACRLGVLRSERYGSRPGTGVYRIPRYSWEAFKRNALVKPPRPTLVTGAAAEPLIDQVMRRRA